MTRYRKKQQPPQPSVALVQKDYVLGMLYIANVNTYRKATGETTKHRVLMVGCEAGDIERKLRWVFDATSFDEFSITKVEKVREKVHMLSTVVTQAKSAPTAVIDRGDRQQEVHAPPTEISREQLKLYAVGVTTAVNATDERHALRKVGTALANFASGLSHSGPALSEDSTVQIEEISRSSGYAKPRDVSAEVCRAHMVRG